MKELTIGQISEFLKIGIRPLKMGEEPWGNVVAYYALIPTRKGKKWRKLDREWEGSYIPLIIYKGGKGAILVGNAEKWQKKFCPLISEILGAEVQARRD